MMLSILVAATTLVSCSNQTTPRARLDAFVAAFNTQDLNKIRQMVDQDFSPKMFQSRKAEEWASQTQQFALNFAPISVEKILLDKPEAIVALIETKGGRKMGLRLDFEGAAPHQIIGIRFGDPENLSGGPIKFDFSDYKNLNDLATKVRDFNHVPAIAIATWKDGVINSAVNGKREAGKPAAVTKNDLWLVGSIGKSMTATLIGFLIEEGKLKWDSKLGELLPKVKMRDEYRAITIEQLLQHRSGLPQDSLYDGVTVARIVGKNVTPTDIRASYANDILNRPPLAKLMEKFAYSNAGYAILGHITEIVTGQPYEKLMKTYVFDKIGMPSALVGMPGTKGQPSGEGQPHGHLRNGTEAIPHILQGPINHMTAPAGGGVCCTIEDLAGYAAWHMREFNGENLGLKPETVQRLHTPIADQPYAAGWVMDTRTPNPFHGHNGSDGTFVAEMAFWPKEKFVAVSIINEGFEASPTPPMQAILTIYNRLFGQKTN